MNKIKFILLALAFGIAGFLIGLGASDFQNANLPQKKEQAAVYSAAASLMIDTGDDLLGFEYIPLQTADTVYSVLDKLSKENESLSLDIVDYGDIGMFINSINNYKSGDNNKYWQYWVNNKYADVAADKYVLEDGDVILWKFTSSRFQNF